MHADEILFVLNNLESIDYDALEFEVITAGSNEIPGTGRAAGRMIHLPEPSYGPFTLGEVLVLDKRWGYEPFGEGRKPGKWWVTSEPFATLAEAMHRRNQVLAAAAVESEPPASQDRIEKTECDCKSYEPCKGECCGVGNCSCTNGTVPEVHGA
jgi:hypothetical protein